jgi:filamentous hemagglutinin family protein
MLSQYWIFSIGFALANFTSILATIPCYADIQADSSIGTQVNPNDPQQTYQIVGGSSAGQNLFHSFLKFSVEEGWTAQFQLPNNNIFNVITRVTGSSASSINGTLAIEDVGHPVSLFLINPNGIIFGPNTSLNLSGSFVASTAESITFSDGYRFSTKDPKSPSSILTLGVPIGLQFGASPGPIEGQFTEPDSVPLLTSAGQTLALVGGEINLQGHPLNPSNRFDRPSTLAAFDGRLEIAGVGAGTTVGLISPNRDRSWALDLFRVQNFNNIAIGNGLVLGGGFSDIFIYGKQIRLTDRVQVSGPVDPDLNRGLVSITASEILELKNNVNISPVTFNSTARGDIRINAEILRLMNSRIDTTTFAEDDNSSGQAGKITVQSEQIFIEDNSFISTTSSSSALAGNIKITTNDLILDGNARISSSARQKGGAGTIDIFARSTVLNNGSSIQAASTSGMGGNINLSVSDSLLLRNQSNIFTSSTTTGNGGNIAILAGLIAAVPEENSNISTDAVFGNGGNIKITTQGLFGIFPNTANFPNSSDITARSEFGINGTIDTSIVSTTPVTDLASLPTVLGQKILKTECFGTRSGGDRDSFIYSGRGGLPNTPSDPSQNIAIWQDFRTVPSLISQGNDRHTSVPSKTSQSITTAPPIIEAQGFSFKPDGSVVLVAAQSTSPPPSQTCALANPTSQSSASGS